MKILLWLVLPLFVFAQSYDLKTLINHANTYNGLVKAKELNVKSKQKEVNAAESAYWPTLDVGANHSYVSPATIVSPGEVSSASAILGMELYDGGRKSAVLRGKHFEHEASLFEKSAFEKSVTLDIVRHYYDIRKLKAILQALQERSNELHAQIGRVGRFNEAGLATQEEVDKLRSVYDNNDYTIANSKLALATSEENLELLSGLSAKHLKNNYFKEPKNIQFELFENTKILQANANAVGENANAINAGYQPQVSVSNTYNKSHYDDTVSSPGFDQGNFLLDHQNKVMLSVNMRLFDNGKMSKESEAVKYQKLALLSQSEYSQKEQRMNFKLAEKRLQTMRTKLKSAKSALKASTSTYGVLRQKFEAGLSDNIAFLDSLAERTLSQARYQETLYDYEISKSIYYYYAGKNPKEFIR